MRARVRSSAQRPAPTPRRRRLAARTALRAAVLALLAAPWAVGAVGPVLAQSGSGAAPRPAESFAFAKASPLRVYDTPSEDGGGRMQTFVFGRAYEARKSVPGLMQVKLDDGRSVYVRTSQIQLVSTPRLARSTAGYNRAERNRIQLWESVTKLTGFLSGDRTAQAEPDFEETFSDAPGFDIALPVIQSDTVDLLDGVKQHRILAVLVPVGRRAYEAFERARTSLRRMVDLHCVIDVSGSTSGFLAPVMSDIARGLGQERLRDRIATVTLTTFGAGRHEVSAFRGTLTPRALMEVVWHPPGVDQTTAGDREPLVDGLMTLSRGLTAGRGEASVLLVVSGADVDQAAQVGATGPRTAVEEIDLAASTAIFGQVTPEPGTDLLQASRRLHSVPSVRYLEYSRSLADEILAELVRASEGTKSEDAQQQAFAPVVAAWHRERMLAILPRVVAPNARLIGRPAYAAEADWFAVQLWLPENPDLFKEAGP